MSCVAATYTYEKSHREQRRARRYHHKDEDHGSPKILLLSAGTQRPLRRNQDCQPCRSEDTKGKGIPSRNYVRWKTHMASQRKENRRTGSQSQDEAMPRVLARNKINRAHVSGWLS